MNTFDTKLVIKLAARRSVLEKQLLETRTKLDELERDLAYINKILLAQSAPEAHRGSRA